MEGKLDKMLDPVEIWGADYVNQHLAKFENGVSCLSFKSVKEQYQQLGRSDGLFVIPKKEMEDLLKRTTGNISEIERELGIPEGEWLEKTINGDELILFNFSSNQISDKNLRMPIGSESGADKKLWLPGGKTIGGYSEAVINAFQWTDELDKLSIKVIK